MTNQKKNGKGRPQEPLQLPEEWIEEVLELYEQGASDVEIKAKIIGWRGSISNSLWNRWMLEEPVFSTTIKKGRQLSAAWWERNGRQNLQNKDFNFTGWYMNMKNRFGWKDKSEVDHQTKGESLNHPKELIYQTAPTNGIHPDSVTPEASNGS